MNILQKFNLDLKTSRVSAQKMDISLDGLESWLSDLDGKFATDLRLKGLSFDRSNNESLGLSGDASDFTIFMPSELSKLRNKDSTFPSATQQAFKDVIKKGLVREDKKIVLIDIATLKPEMQYFIQGGENSVIKSLANAVKDLKEKKVVIRLLVGDERLPPNKEVVDQRWDRPKDYANSLKKRYEEIFWSIGAKPAEGASPEYTPIFDHPDVSLYVGYYCPNFQPR